MILIISPKNVYAAERLKHEAGNMKQKTEILSVEELVKIDFKINVHHYNVLYIRNPYFKGSPKYIPQIIALAKKFKAAGKKVVDDNVTTGSLGLGKWADYKKLKEAVVTIPKTTKTHGRAFYKFPYIAKWQFGMKAKGTFLIRSESDLKKIPEYIPSKELMPQEYIEADYEYKVITVGYKALPVVLRFGFNKKYGRVDFAEHRACNIKTVKGLKNIAEKASKVLGRELAKLDILQKGKKFYVLEVNRFPGLKSFEEMTKYNVTRDFVKYLQK